MAQVQGRTRPSWILPIGPMGEQYYWQTQSVGHQPWLWADVHGFLSDSLRGVIGRVLPHIGMEGRISHLGVAVMQGLGTT